MAIRNKMQGSPFADIDFPILKQITFSRKIETTCRIRKVIIYEDELDGIETDVVSNLDNLPFP